MDFNGVSLRNIYRPSSSWGTPIYEKPHLSELAMGFDGLRQSLLSEAIKSPSGASAFRTGRIWSWQMWWAAAGPRGMDPGGCGLCILCQADYKPNSLNQFKLWKIILFNGYINHKYGPFSIANCKRLPDAHPHFHLLVSCCVRFNLTRQREPNYTKLLSTSTIKSAIALSPSASSTSLLCST